MDSFFFQGGFSLVFAAAFTAVAALAAKERGRLSFQGPRFSGFERG